MESTNNGLALGTRQPTHRGRERKGKKEITNEEVRHGSASVRAAALRAGPGPPPRGQPDPRGPGARRSGLRPAPRGGTRAGGEEGTEQDRAAPAERLREGAGGSRAALPRRPPHTWSGTGTGLPLHPHRDIETPAETPAEPPPCLLCSHAPAPRGSRPSQTPLRRAAPSWQGKLSPGHSSGTAARAVPRRPARSRCEGRSLTFRLHLLPPPRSGAPRAAARRAGLSGYKGGRRARGVGFLSLPLQLHRAMRLRQRDEAPPKAAAAGAAAAGAAPAAARLRPGPCAQRDPAAAPAAAAGRAARVCSGSKGLPPALRRPSGARVRPSAP